MNVLDITIDAATVNDALPISKVQCQTWKSAYKGQVSQKFLNELTESHWQFANEKMIFSKDKLMFVARHNDQVVGMVAGGKSRWDDEGVGEVYALYVLQNYQKYGIGRSLMTTIQNALKHHYKQLKVLTLHTNKPSIAFYERIGLTLTTQTIDSEIFGHKYTCVVFSGIL